MNKSHGSRLTWEVSQSWEAGGTQRLWGFQGGNEALVVLSGPDGNETWGKARLRNTILLLTCPKYCILCPTSREVINLLKSVEAHRSRLRCPVPALVKLQYWKLVEPNKIRFLFPNRVGSNTQYWVAIKLFCLSNYLIIWTNYPAINTTVISPIPIHHSFLLNV